MPISIFLYVFFRFRLTSPCGTDGQTDGRAKRATRPTGGPHNNQSYNQSINTHQHIAKNCDGISKAHGDDDGGNDANDYDDDDEKRER